MTPPQPDPSARLAASLESRVAAEVIRLLSLNELRIEQPERLLALAEGDA